MRTASLIQRDRHLRPFGNQFHRVERIARQRIGCQCQCGAAETEERHQQQEDHRHSTPGRLPEQRRPGGQSRSQPARFALLARLLAGNRQKRLSLPGNLGRIALRGWFSRQLQRLYNVER